MLKLVLEKLIIKLLSILFLFSPIWGFFYLKTLNNLDITNTVYPWTQG